MESTTAALGRGGGWRRWSVHAVAVLLLAGFLAMGLSASRHWCVAGDELIHVMSGYTYWATGDYRMQPENGNLPQRLEGLGVLLTRPKLPSFDLPAWRNSDEWEYGWQFFYHAGNDPARLLWAARCVVAGMSVLLGILIYLWSSRLFGAAGGLLSLTLFAFSPIMLSHGMLATSDAIATFFFLASVGAWWRLLHRPGVGTLALSCLATAGLFTSKMSAPLVIGMMLVMAAVWAWKARHFQFLGLDFPLQDACSVPADPAADAAPAGRRSAKDWGRWGRAAAITGVLLLVHGVVVYAAIWMMYGFRYSMFAPPGVGTIAVQGGWQTVLNSNGPAVALLGVARRYHLLPEAYLFGNWHVFHYAQARRAFLDGSMSSTGWPWFFPYAWLMKTPLGTMGVLVLAVAALGRFRSSLFNSDSTSRIQPAHAASPPEHARGKVWWYELTPLLALITVYGLAAVTSHINIGIRHILPIEPALLILAGAAGAWVTARRTWGTGLIKGLLAACVVVLVVESLSVWPSYLSFFNEAAGGPANGYKHLVDSSYDWGQDLPALKHWLHRHGYDRTGPGATPVYLSYFGLGDPQALGIHAIYLPCFRVQPLEQPYRLLPLGGGVYCISATMLQGIYTVAPGPWTRWHERVYRTLWQTMRELDRPGHSPYINESVVRDNTISMLNQFLLARLCAYLRHIRPVGQPGYSILVYKLSTAQVQKAIFGPAAEMVDKNQPPGE